MFPLVHTIAVDNPEHCILAGTLYGYGTNCQCSACLTPKDVLGDLEGSAKYPVRTVQMFTALRAAMEDASGRKAMQLYKSHLEAEAAVNTASAVGWHQAAPGGFRRHCRRCGPIRRPS